MKRVRAGAVLVELVVAVALTTLVAAQLTIELQVAERYVRRASLSSDDRRTIREVETILASDLAAVALDSLRLRGDTATEFFGLVGTSVACLVAAGELVLPPSVAASPIAVTVWRAVPAAGDLVAAFDTTGAGAWRIAIVDSVQSRADGAGCTPASGLVSIGDSVARRTATRLLLDRTLPPGIGVGAPVRLLRRGRYVLSRAADRSWSLSYRPCPAAAACGTAEPVAGPLGAAADSGLVFSFDVARALLEAGLRAPTRDWAPESGHFLITLRNRATGSN